MPQSVVAVSASETDPHRLREILNSHLAYDRARIFRASLLPWMAAATAIDLALRAAGDVQPSVFWSVLAGAGVLVAAALAREAHTRSRFDRAAAATASR